VAISSICGEKNGRLAVRLMVPRLAGPFKQPPCRHDA
jgi:hypothetical protein